MTVDAEDHTTTDSTLSIVRTCGSTFPGSAPFCRPICDAPRRLRRVRRGGARIRLCKGAYDEPASVAYREPAAVTDAYLRCLRVLMSGSGYPMVASHDPAISMRCPRWRANRAVVPRDFEYQMLYGIRDDEQRRLADAGNQVRVYVPFGTQWYGYFMRRLAERPANLTFFLRALADRGVH